MTIKKGFIGLTTERLGVRLGARNDRTKGFHTDLRTDPRDARRSEFPMNASGLKWRGLSSLWESFGRAYFAGWKTRVTLPEKCTLCMA